MSISDKSHLKNKIITKLRLMTREWEPIIQAEKNATVDSATVECALCGTYVYKGDSSKSLQKLKDKYPSKNVIKCTIYRDHILPAVPVDKSQLEMSYDELVESHFCDISNIQCLCKKCHDCKTKQETSLRKNNRKVRRESV